MALFHFALLHVSRQREGIPLNRRNRAQNRWLTENPADLVSPVVQKASKPHEALVRIPSSRP